MSYYLPFPKINEQGLIYCKKCNGYFPSEHFKIINYKKPNKNLGNKQYICLVNDKRLKEGHYDYMTKFKDDLSYGSYDYARDRYLRRTYGINLIEFNEMLQRQDNKCPICSRTPNDFKRAFNVDHCHITGKNRGILCQDCNSSIGRLNDDIELIRQSIEYINTHPEKIKHIVSTFNLLIRKMPTSKKMAGYYLYSSCADDIYSFRINKKDYNKLFEFQHGYCAICNKHGSEFKKKLGVDHDHKTGEIRGLLCYNCNLSIGQMNDDIILLNRAIDYLSSYNYLKVN